MRSLFFLFIVLFFTTCVSGQEINTLEGSVSYISGENIYVTFQSTRDISVGDTLYIVKSGTIIPALRVENRSSISCVCKPLINNEFKVSDKIMAKPGKKPEEQQETPKIVTEPAPILATDSLPAIPTSPAAPVQDISGRVSVSSYSDISNTPAENTQRMRYNISLNARNIDNSKLSAETYIAFVHSNVNWDDVQSNIFNGLKIYNLALKYGFNETTTLYAGRKINPRISSVGAIDGIQFEKKIKPLSVGIFAGSRPDYADYSFDFNLVQFGAYVSHDLSGKKGSMTNSVALIEQKNDFNTDRRFLYFQHTNSLATNLFFFGSAETDLYKVEMVDTVSSAKNTFDLTNLYLSLRYKFTRKFSVSASYNNRKNIIYYETYKTFFERMLDYHSQGWRLQLSYRPVNMLSMGVTSGYRFEKDDPDPARNIYAYVTYNRIPGLNLATTLSYTMLETSYNRGNVYSLGFSRDIIPGRMSGTINYRRVNYRYFDAELDLGQHIGDLSITWRIRKGLSFSTHYEGTFEKERNYHRLYLNLNRSF